jgi:hypothetical protein
MIKALIRDLECTEQRNLTAGRLLNLPDMERQFPRRYREWKRGVVNYIYDGKRKR